MAHFMVKEWEPVNCTLPWCLHKSEKHSHIWGASSAIIVVGLLQASHYQKYTAKCNEY